MRCLDELSTLGYTRSGSVRELMKRATCNQSQ